MKSKIILVVPILLFLFMMEGCNQNDSVQKSEVFNSANSEKIKIRWLAQWYGEGKKELLIREIARDFSFANQQYEVEVEFPHQMLKIDWKKQTFQLTSDSIRKMIESNNWPYDIMLCDSYIYDMVAKNCGDTKWGEKYLLNFIDKKWFIDAHKDNLFAGKLYTGGYGDIAPGVFLEGSWNVFYVSSVTEEKLGLKIKRENMTLDDFKSYAKAVYEYNQSHDDKITFFWALRDGTSPMFSQLVLSVLGKDSASNNEEAFSVLEIVYNELEKLAKYKPLEQYIVAETDRSLYEDKILMSYNPSWISLLWQSTNPEGEKKMHPCEMPSIDNKVASSYSGRYSAIFVIPKNAKHKDAAEQLMKFISSPEIAEKWVKYSKCPTGLKHRIVYSDFSLDEINRFSEHIRAKYNNRLAEIRLYQILFKTGKRLDFKIKQVMSGEMTTSDAINSIKEQLKEE